jgi:hypothetical protein
VSPDKNHKTLQAVKDALELAGGESKQVILAYMQERYGMDLNALARYKDEFTNYLGEILGDSAEIISARIDKTLQEYVRSASNPVCYICERSFAPEEMHRHLMFEHTKEEMAYHLGVIYIDDWREETEWQDENDSTLRQLLHN